MKLGFTGTDVGMTRAQMATVRRYIIRWRFLLESAHHGDCIGADEQFHSIVRMEVPGLEICGHIPDIPTKRAFCDFDAMMQPLPYIHRNHEIVSHSTEVMATPRGFQEVMRSGTWATMRWARNHEVPLTIIWPDGTVGRNW